MKPIVNMSMYETDSKYANPPPRLAALTVIIIWPEPRPITE